MPNVAHCTCNQGFIQSQVLLDLCLILNNSWIILVYIYIEVLNVYVSVDQLLVVYKAFTLV